MNNKKRFEMFKSLRSKEIKNFLKKETKIEVIKFCNINLPTGKIVANDPLVMYEFDAYSEKVKPGKYPVYLYILHIKTDKRVAFAEIRFNKKEPTTFELARTNKQLNIKLKYNQYLGYGTDSGTGGFMDEEIALKIKQLSDEENERYWQELDSLIEKSYINTYGTANYKLKGSTSNIVAFSSGYGDGVYASYFGYDKNNNICSLITDFNTIYVQEETDWEEVERKVNDGFYKIYDSGNNHNNKITSMNLDTDPLAGFNHLAIYLRFCILKNIISDELLSELPDLKKWAKDKTVDLRKVIRDEKTFNGSLTSSHFNDLGNKFTLGYYVFNISSDNYYPSCVDSCALDYFGKEKYNSKEFKNEAYLFVPYDENYYNNLSQYIEKNWKNFINRQKLSKEK